MKRTIFLLPLFLVALMLSGCELVEDFFGGSDSGDITPFSVVEREPVTLPSPKAVEPTASESAAESVSEPAEESTDPDALLSELMFHVDLINSCYAETCGAQLDDSVLYKRVYTSEEAFLNGEKPIDVVSDGAMSYEERHDLTDATLYEITNFKSNDDAFRYLTNYMTEDLAKSLFPNEFLEMNDKLYMVYESRGYGAYQLDPATAVLTEISDSNCVMKIDGILFDERTQCEIGFTKTANGWQAYYIIDTDC